MSLLFFVLSALIPNVNFTPADAKRQEKEPAESSIKGTDVVSTVIKGREAVERDSRHFEETLNHTFPKIMFVLVPLFALLLKAVYRNRRQKYPQFLYFSLHIHAALFGLLIFTLPLQSFASDTAITAAQGIVLLATFVYLIVALKRVFGGRSLQTFLRAGVVTGAYLLIFSAAVAMVVVGLFYKAGQSSLH